MFTPSARAAFHRLAARAHERSALDPSRANIETAESRTDNAWSASFGEGGDRGSRAQGEEQEHALDASEMSETGYPREAAAAHRKAAKWARAG